MDEIIHWSLSGMPDSDETVLVQTKDDEVFCGFHDGECWRCADAERVHLPVKAWARMPQGVTHEPQTNSHLQAWELTRRLGLDPVRWSLILPNGDSLDGLTTEAAAISARAYLRPMWAALVEPPADLYQAFHTDGKGWGFFDREGNLHAQFPSRADAAGCAARREDADYASH